MISLNRFRLEIRVYYLIQKGSWKGKSSGGCLNFPSWRYNSQILMTISKPVKVRIELEQLRSTNLHFIGFYVVKSNGQKKILQVTKKELISNTEFINLQKGFRAQAILILLQFSKKLSWTLPKVPVYSFRALSHLEMRQSIV